MPRRFLLVDVFSDRPFQGNPVAVVVDAEGLSTDAMQRIARWTNLSETTFCFPASVPEADYQLRIFTPQAELPFAGHPTLGSARALQLIGQLASKSKIIQECCAGLIPIRIEGGKFWFRLPEPRLSPLAVDDRNALQQALRVPLGEGPVHLIDVGPKWVIVRLSSREQLQTLRPDLGLLASFEQRVGATGVTVFASDPMSGSADIDVRSFAPSQGVPEDPVCGSGNGAVAVFRRDLESLSVSAGYCAKQGSAVGRDGQVEIRYVGPAEIWVGGSSVITADGVLNCD